MDGPIVSPENPQGPTSSAGPCVQNQAQLMANTTVTVSVTSWVPG
jgi:hypothetical protein